MNHDQPQTPAWASALKVQIDRIETVICGPYGKPEQGVISRLDDVEKDLKSAKRIGWTAILGGAGTFGAWVIGHFAKGNP